MNTIKWWSIFASVLVCCGTAVACVALATDAATFEQIAKAGGGLLGFIAISLFILFVLG